MKIRKYIILSLLMLAVMALTACGRTEVRLNEYLTAKVSSANGRGTIGWTLDAETLVQDHRAAFGLNEQDSPEAAADAVRTLTGTFSQSDSLFNGDVVTFAWDSDSIRALEQAYKVKLIADSMTVTVSGLAEMQQLDPFDNVTVGYQENGGEVLPLLKPTGDIPFWLDFIVTNQTALHPGDSFTVRIGKTVSGEEMTQEQIADFALNQGYEITRFEKEYQVPKSG